MRRLAVWLATGFGVGHLPAAPASWASLATVLCLLPFLHQLDRVILGLVILILIPIGVWAAGEAERSLGHDARPIVIDEIAGMLIAVWGVPLGAHPIVMLPLAFVLFRCLDVWKPFPIRSSQRLPGGWGIMVDDILAGAATNVLLRLTAVILLR
jgi:phosphatidylglycerophosphatase A